MLDEIQMQFVVGFKVTGLVVKMPFAHNANAAFAKNMAAHQIHFQHHFVCAGRLFGGFLMQGTLDKIMRFEFAAIQARALKILNGIVAI